jgi:regulator of sigma E protease
MIWINILSILAALVLLGIIIIVHELGHYTIGRALGLKIDEFALGFGPKIAKKKSKKTGILYSIRPFPIGGFIKFHGEDQEAVDEDAFSRKPVWKRFLAIFAGAAFNIIFALILAVIFLTAFGEDAPAVKTVEAGRPAAEAGIMAGDRIISINGQKFEFYMEAYTYMTDLSKTKPSNVTLTILRDNKLKDYTVNYFLDEKENRYRIGFEWGAVRIQYGFFEALGMSFKWVIFIIKQMFAFLGGLIFGTASTTDAMGPVGIIATIGTVIQRSFEMVLRLAALLCINLGIINLLPLPALDGGRLVLLVIEGIRRKPIPPKKEGYIHLAGFILFIALIVLLTYQDIARLVT